MGKSIYNSYSKSRGFALAEVVVALFIATLAIALVAGLGQQVMDLAKRSSQTGTVLELRSMVNSISRNPSAWIEKMRGSVNLNGLYAGCIPDPKLNISTFSCPSLDADVLTKDKELAEIAGNNFHVSSAPIINSNGDLIAGTASAPVYLTNEGRVCEGAACAFKSTGYFLRSNDKSDADPGSVKFVIKIEKNNIAANNAPMKPQYLSIHVGEEWKSFDVQVSGVCPSGAIKVGYLSNGQPSCINPSKKCMGVGEYSIGTDSAGNTICKKLPASCPVNSGYALNASGTDIECAASSVPCGANNIFLGYYGGSGEPMCSGADIKCAEGQVQVGVNIAGGNIAAECAAIPVKCTDANNRLTYDGEKFVCQSAAVAVTCGENQTMSGMRADGTPICVDRAPASVGNQCPTGQVAYSITKEGEIKCRAIEPADLRGIGACAANQYLAGFDGAGNKICGAVPQPLTGTSHSLYLGTLAALTPGMPAGWDGTCSSVFNYPAVYAYINTGCRRWCNGQGYNGGAIAECGNDHTVCQCFR